jgi:hypothetical protein
MTPAFRRLWGWPLLLGIVSAVGLASALVGDGAWDALSWACLGLPIVVAARHLWGR